MVDVIGFTMMILAVAMAVIALPSQILKNHREGRVGITWWMIGLALGVYSLRAVYSFLIGSYYILIPDVFGTIFSSIILYQALRHPRLEVVEFMEIQGWLRWL